MPIFHVKKEIFDKYLGKTLSIKELDDLCFEYGIEVEEEEKEEEVVQQKKEETKEETKQDDKKKAKKEKKDNKKQAGKKYIEYAFEVQANRADLLSIEGLTQALKVFLKITEIPQFKISGAPENRQKIIVKTDCKRIRPYVVGAVLRDVNFTQDAYNSFIDLQDKLHHNLCRRRRLVAIGTHDLDTVKGPFIYDARKPEDISFIPLNQTKKMNGKELMEFYKQDLHLKEFLPIIQDSPVYPVILDASETVCSLPPIINGEHSKIQVSTKNVFIESTATDYQKALNALNTILAAFSQYCKDPFTFEEVEVYYEETKETRITPDIKLNKFQITIQEINKKATLEIDTDTAVGLLNKMLLAAKKLDDNTIEVTPPITRSDVLQNCDIIEDVAIAYGYNNIVKKLPQSLTIGKQFILNKMSDLVREEMANAGYQEGLNFILCSKDDLTSNLRIEKDPLACTISNAKSEEFTRSRTTLIPGLLRWIQHNKEVKNPINVFEVGDVVLKAPGTENGSKNERRLCALYTNNSANLEVIHGLLDYLMLKLNVEFSQDKNKNSYQIEPSNIPTFFPDRQANIIYKNESIGIFGIIHPEVNKKFELKYPVSLLEINLEPLFKNFI